jgi:MFS family permease
VAVDRLGARRVAIAADLASCPAQLAIGLLLLGGHVDIPLLAAIAAVTGVAAAFDTPANLPLVAGTTEGEARQGANALLGIAASATNLAGPAVAGALVLTVGAGWAFVLDAGTFAFSAGTLALIAVRPVQAAKQSLRADLVAGWQEVRARTWYWTSLVGHGTWNFALGMLLTTGPLIAVAELGGKVVWLAALQAGAVGYLAGAFVAGRASVSRVILACDAALVALALPLVLFAAAAPAWAVVPAYGLATAGIGFLNPVWETAVQQEIPGEVLARVSSYDWLASLAAMPLGYALGPVLGRAVGYAWPLAGAAVLVVATACIPLAQRDVRDLRLRRELPTDGLRLRTAAELPVLDVAVGEVVE